VLVTEHTTSTPPNKACTGQLGLGAFLGFFAALAGFRTADLVEIMSPHWYIVCGSLGRSEFDFLLVLRRAP
jgi:hypothetical protein